MLKIILIAFIVFAFSRAVLRFRDKSIGIREFLFWTFLWTIVTILIFNPNISDIAATSFGIGRGADAAFFLSIILLFYAMFRLYVKIDKLDRDITDLTVEVSKKLREHDRL
ncbi:MAG: DUF2304 family protein [Candidatus Moraniibacteriota bacterium]